MLCAPSASNSPPLAGEGSRAKRGGWGNARHPVVSLGHPAGCTTVATLPASGRASGGRFTKPLRSQGAGSTRKGWPGHDLGDKPSGRRPERSPQSRGRNKPQAGTARRAPNHRTANRQSTAGCPSRSSHRRSRQGEKGSALQEASGRTAPGSAAPRARQIQRRS